MLERLLNWLRGYFIIRIPECDILFFLNICNVSNIILNNIQHRHNEYMIRVAASDYNELLHISDENNMSFDIYKKCGLPKLLRRCID